VFRSVPVCMHASANTPADFLGDVARQTQETAAFPDCRQVGFRIIRFEACSAFTRVPAYMLAKSPKVTLYTRGFDRFVTSSAAPIATGWSDQLPGGSLTH